MRVHLLTLTVVMATAAGAPAQRPDVAGTAPPARLDPTFPPLASSPKQSAPTAGPIEPSQTPQKFETATLRLKREHGRWQLWAGALLLKDFGPAEADANESLQVFRDLRVDSFGTIGGVFEYWLADGHAPSAVTRHRQVVPFELASLRAEQVSGNWVLRDARIILYNFGRSQAEAQQALAVCKHYGFNQLGYVGHPVPAMKYLMRDPEQAAGLSGPAPLVPASARMQAMEAAHSRLVLPGVGDIGDRLPLDVRHLDLRREGGDWVLYAGRSPLAHYGISERDGRLALEALQQFRITELCRLGDSGFAFFLANGRPPQGSVIGTGAKPLRAELLTVRQVGPTWAVCEGQRPLFQFGDHESEARHALAAIREFHFDQFVTIHAGPIGQTYLFVKTRY